MKFKLTGYIDLPAHAKQGGPDLHAAVHTQLVVYVAHTANGQCRRLIAATATLHSIPTLAECCGAPVSFAKKAISFFTSNRAEKCRWVFSRPMMKTD